MGLLGDILFGIGGEIKNELESKSARINHLMEIYDRRPTEKLIEGLREHKYYGEDAIAVMNVLKSRGIGND